MVRLQLRRCPRHHPLRPHLERKHRLPLARAHGRGQRTWLEGRAPRWPPSGSGICPPAAETCTTCWPRLHGRARRRTRRHHRIRSDTRRRPARHPFTCRHRHIPLRCCASRRPARPVARHLPEASSARWSSGQLPALGTHRRRGMPHHRRGVPHRRRGVPHRRRGVPHRLTCTRSTARHLRTVRAPGAFQAASPLPTPLPRVVVAAAGAAAAATAAAASVAAVAGAAVGVAAASVRRAPAVRPSAAPVGRVQAAVAATSGRAF